MPDQRDINQENRDRFYKLSIPEVDKEIQRLEKALDDNYRNFIERPDADEDDYVYWIRDIAAEVKAAYDTKLQIESEKKKDSLDSNLDSPNSESVMVTEKIIWDAHLRELFRTQPSDITWYTERIARKTNTRVKHERDKFLFRFYKL